MFVKYEQNDGIDGREGVAHPVADLEHEIAHTARARRLERPRHAEYGKHGHE